MDGLDITFGFLADLCSVNEWSLELHRAPLGMIVVRDGDTVLASAKFNFAIARLDVVAEIVFDTLYALGRV